MVLNHYLSGDYQIGTMFVLFPEIFKMEPFWAAKNPQRTWPFPFCKCLSNNSDYLFLYLFLIVECHKIVEGKCKKVVKRFVSIFAYTLIHLLVSAEKPSMGQRRE